MKRTWFFCEIKAKIHIIEKRIEQALLKKGAMFFFKIKMK